MRAAIAALLVVVGVSILSVGTVYAHAAPAAYEPAAGSVISTAPSEIVIRFTERIEPKASRILVLDKRGTKVSGETTVDSDNPYIFRVPISPTAESSYLVSWHVISADDGHFTQGAYGFSIGTTTDVTVASMPSAETFEIAHSSTYAEAVTLWIELLGQALLLGLLVVAASIAPLVPGADGAEARRRFARMGAAAIALIVAGAISYLYLESATLRSLERGTLGSALGKLAQTVSGSFTIYRLILALLSAGLLAGYVKASQATRKRLFWQLLIVCVLAMELLRARVSHAAASHFYPTLSVAINFVHLVFKDLWVGVVIVVAYWLGPITGALDSIRRRLSRLLAAAYIGGGVTGSYIVWLHLKHPDYILITDWGVRFIAISLFGGLLFAARMFQEIVRPSRRAFYFEALTGVVLLGATALMIITTPPIDTRPAFELSALSSDGSTILLSPHPFDERRMLVRFQPEDVVMSDAVITIMHGEKNLGPIVVPSERVSERGFVFDREAFSVHGDWRIEITGRRQGQYDAVGSFTLRQPHTSTDRPRVIDGFAILMTLVSLGIVLFGIAWYRGLLGKRTGLLRTDPRAFEYAAVYLSWTLLLAYAISPFFVSSYQRVCERSGHRWDVRTPLVDGVQTGPLAVPGCTVVIGVAQEHIGDYEEYLYKIRPARSTVEFLTDPTKVSRGASTTLIFNIADEEGPTDELVASHDAPLHVITISSDFNEFAHTHGLRTGQGRYEARQKFGRSGTYLVAADYLIRTTPFTVTNILDVAGPLDAKPPRYLISPRAAIGPYEVALVGSTDLVAGKKIQLRIDLIKNGNPIRLVDRYYGMPMHLSVVRDDLSSFIHTHAMYGVPLGAAHAHAHGGVTESESPVLTAELTFPAPGTYHLFAEFRDNGSVHLAHMVALVK